MTRCWVVIYSKEKTREMSLSQLEDHVHSVKPSNQEVSNINEYLKKLLKEYRSLEMANMSTQVKGKAFTTLPSDYIGSVPETIECTFIKPTSLDIVGSWVNNSCIRKNDMYAVDVAISMPKDCVAAKSDVNYKYIIQRNYYLSEFVKKLNEKLDVKIKIEKSSQSWYGVLQVDSIDLRVRLIVVCDKDCFDLNRLDRKRNNIRVEGIEFEKLPPTPMYNNLLSKDIYALELSKRLNIDSLAYSTAISVLKLFIYNHNLCLSSCALTYLCCQVCEESNDTLSTTQLVKAVLKVIIDKTQFEITDKYSCLYYNTWCYLDMIPINKFDSLVQECEYALSIMEIDLLWLFSTSMSWDHDMLFTMTKTVPSFYNVQSKLELTFPNFLQNALERLIAKACPFIKTINVTVTDTIRFQFNCSHVPSNLIRGPKTQTKEATLFAQLWKENCQQRKFKDGLVNVCVEFDSDVVYLMIQKLLQVHLKDCVLLEEPKLYSHHSESKESPLFTLLKELDLPLPISQIHHLHMNFYALELEMSMSWPDNLIVMQSTKILFLCKLIKLLPTQYKAELKINSVLKSKNPFSMYQQVWITDKKSKEVFKCCLLVHREYDLIKKELESKNKRQIKFPDLAVPEGIIDSKASVMLLKRKAGDYTPYDLTHLIKECDLAYELLFHQTILHTRDIKRCSTQYGLFRPCLDTVQTLLNKEGVLSMSASNLIISFNSGGLPFMQRQVERAVLSVFTHTYPYSTAPQSLEAAVTRVYEKLQSGYCHYDMDGPYKHAIIEKTLLTRTALDVKGTWFGREQMQSNFLRTIYKVLAKSIEDIKDSNTVNKKSLFKVQNLVEYESLMHLLYPNQLILLTNKQDTVYHISSKHHINKKEMKRLSKLI